MATSYIQAPHKMIVKAGNNSSAYMPNGLILKWGSHGGIGNKILTNITFDEPFLNVCWFVTAICSQEEFAAYANISCSNLSKTGFKVYQTNNANAQMPIRWLAIGR